MGSLKRTDIKEEGTRISLLIEGGYYKLFV
jgi:hypothetical protein